MPLTGVVFLADKGDAHVVFSHDCSEGCVLSLSVLIKCGEGVDWCVCAEQCHPAPSLSSQSPVKLRSQSLSCLGEEGGLEL